MDGGARKQDEEFMNLLRAIVSRIVAELRLQWLGRRSLREVRFSKYKVAPKQGDRRVAERLLRRLPGELGTSRFNFTTTH